MKLRKRVKYSLYKVSKNYSFLTRCVKLELHFVRKRRIDWFLNRFGFICEFKRNTIHLHIICHFFNLPITIIVGYTCNLEYF